MLIDILTFTAGLRTRIETVNLDHLRPVFRGYVLEFLDKGAKSKVVDLPSPQPRHATKAQVLNAKGAVPAAQLMARLPLPVIATVTDTLMTSLKVLPPFAAMIGAFLAAGQSPRLTTQFLQAGLQEKGIVNPCPVGEREVRLQAEVHANGCTIA